MELARAKASRYHRAFVQNEDGKKILEHWVQTYAMRGITKPDATLFELGLAEGRRSIITEILNQIQTGS